MVLSLLLRTKYRQVPNAAKLYGMHLEWHCVWRLIEEHQQLAGTDGKVWTAELVRHIPTQWPKLEALLLAGTAPAAAAAAAAMHRLL
jgi:hypothetical protein